MNDPALERLSLAHTIGRNRSTLLAQAVRIACKAASVVVLARLVPPAGHGLFAMAASVTFLLLLFRDAGLGTAAVQAATLDVAQLAALRRAHFLLGLVLAALALVLAPLAAWFYATPAVAPLLATMSAAFVCIGASGFPRAQLARELRFAELARIEAVTAVAGTAAMIAAGALGAGAYSFAVFLLVTEALSALLACRAYPWRARQPADLRRLRGLLQTGTHVTGYHAVNQLLGNLDTILVGHVLGPRALGLYNRPSQLLGLGNLYVVLPLSQVALATLSRLGGAAGRFRAQARQTVAVAAHLALPLFTLGAVAPDETVRLVLGSQWAESAPVLRWLSLSTAAEMVGILAYGINVAAGRSPRLVAGALVALPVTALAIWLGLPGGGAGVAFALALAGGLLLVPRLWWTLRGTPVGLADFAAAMAGPLAANLAFGLGLAAGRAATAAHAWPVRLAAGGLAGALAVAALLAVWPRLRREAAELLAHLPWRQTAAP